MINILIATSVITLTSCLYVLTKNNLSISTPKINDSDNSHDSPKVSLISSNAN